ncbi:hypothetical protein AAVH_12673 [Aphelenchoides avenae]|nr:hypothetical protein AAVH_12673 [Aphelenchus avenae]
MSGKDTHESTLDASTCSSQTTIPFLCTFVDKDTNRKIEATEELMHHSGLLQDRVNSGTVSEEAPEVYMPKNEEFHFEHLHVIMDYLAVKRQRDPKGSVPDFENRHPVVSIPPWSQSFFENVERRDMESLVGAANLSVFLVCPSFKHDVCAYIARRTDAMTVLQQRAYLRIEDAYSAEEWDELRNDPDLHELMAFEGILNDK